LEQWWQGDRRFQMRSTGALVRRWPRVAAAVSFGAVGSVIPATWFLPSVLSRRDGAALLLFVVFPGAAATLAGGLVGAPLCDPARIVSQREAVIRGVGVATLAWVIFAPMFAAFFAYTAPGRTNVLGMVILVLTFSVLAIGGVAALVGGAVGWLLHHVVSSQDATKPSSGSW
jgi:hypothetical protein